MNDIRNYRGIALSSLLAKLFDHCITGNQYDSLRSDDLQFAYKSKISAIHCVNSVNETVKYYINNSGKAYVCTMDASKAFDRVNLLTLFKKLFKRNTCSLFLRFFIYSYCNQKMHIKWNAAISCSFDTSNGIKQGGVLSPLLFNVYLDEPILLLWEQGVGCHMNDMFVDAFCYADDVTLLAPTGMALNAMLDTCTRFADTHNLLFNSSKTKYMFIDRSCSQLHSNVRFMGRSVEFVNCVDLLGVPLYADLKVNHMHRNVQKFCCKVNSVLFDFKDIPSDVKSKLIDTYCTILLRFVWLTIVEI